MNSHKNVRLTPRGRELLIERIVSQGLKAVCPAVVAGLALFALGGIPVARCEVRCQHTIPALSTSPRFRMAPDGLVPIQIVLWRY